jgi:hypothetical protein
MAGDQIGKWSTGDELARIRSDARRSKRRTNISAGRLERLVMGAGAGVDAETAGYLLTITGLLREANRLRAEEITHLEAAEYLARRLESGD